MPFDEFMNPPVDDGSIVKAEIRLYRMRNWVFCPYCYKRQFPITTGAKIKGQIFRCKGSTCKKEFEVNV